VTFRGRQSVDIPVGALAVSDALGLPAMPGQILSISIYLHHGQRGIVTSHPGSRTQTWFAHGDHTLSENLRSSDTHSPTIESIFHWYFISAVEAWQPLDHYVLALLGDSITDGRCSTDNGNDRWPDRLFAHMQRSPKHSKISVINLSAGGNRILSDIKGPNVLSRLDRDVFAQPGVRCLLVFHGVNDIGTAEPDAKSQAIIRDRLIWAYEQIIERAHALGIMVIGATIAPFAGHEYSASEREVTRRAVNEWILMGGAFDYVVDFDKVLRHPDQPDRLRVEFDSGDGLHPNLAAFQALADAFPLNWLP
jgi:lysophospholipase L1-like esterase